MTAADAGRTVDEASGDELVLVDLLDRQIGVASKLRCHEEGLLHRAFSVFLVDGSRMLLQRRALGKYHSGGLWTNACCSHPRSGEELARAVGRRLSEELGVEGCPCRELGSFVYRARFEGGLCEYECDHVFVGEFRGIAHPDPAEVAELRWVEASEVERWLRREPDSFTAWFVTAAPMVLAEMLS